MQSIPVTVIFAFDSIAQATATRSAINPDLYTATLPSQHISINPRDDIISIESGQNEIINFIIPGDLDFDHVSDQCPNAPRPEGFKYMEKFKGFPSYKAFIEVMGPGNCLFTESEQAQIAREQARDLQPTPDDIPDTPTNPKLKSMSNYRFGNVSSVTLYYLEQ
jgi:hypothetical protein